MGEASKKKLGDIKSQYEEGTLVDNTKEGVKTYGSALYSFGSTWLNKAKEKAKEAIGSDMHANAIPPSNRESNEPLIEDEKKQSEGDIEKSDLQV